MVINVKLVDKADFNILIKINRKYLKEEKIYRNTQLYIKEEDFKLRCPEKEVCTILISVEMQDPSKDNTRVELTMYQIDSTPHYLEKNIQLNKMSYMEIIQNIIILKYHMKNTVI